MAVSRVGRVVAPVGAAVATWLVVLILLAFGLSLGPLTVSRLVDAVLVGLLAWPVVAVEPWRAGLTQRLDRWARRRWLTLWLMAVIASLGVLLDAVDGPRIALVALRFPVETVGLVRLAALVREHAGAGAATALLFVARVFLGLLWAYLLAAGSVALGRAGRGG